MSFRRQAYFIRFVLPVSILCLFPYRVDADGGAVRLSERKGDYQITVFTAPTPLRAGTIDVSVLVQNAMTHELVSNVQVLIGVKPRGHHGQATLHPATDTNATNKLFRACNFELRTAGWWEFVVSIDDTSTTEQIQFSVEATDSLPKFQALWAWILWPAVPILLVAVHQYCLHTHKNE